jgi:hypothetical protein
MPIISLQSSNPVSTQYVSRNTPTVIRRLHTSSEPTVMSSGKVNVMATGSFVISVSAKDLLLWLP